MRESLNGNSHEFRCEVARKNVLADGHRAMVVTVTPMGVMEMPVDQIVDMVAVRHCGVSATGSVDMSRRVASTAVIGRASRRIQ